ncbi:MerR family DNA-binding transcriptional regulator [Limibaculum sp. FT325]|uniref:MerR family transcriptional regulator n=1 Tax=Thermohalobaculum sediminis TaxID=2939436 RepID=UPI0020C1873C|nr:MerR family DNA-binding transcriptional regulator [Limibaculum sediminis]MCL5777727.1 MerR family DNA-binding transcriptional regulator [Limibaculum sediminis]
MTEDTMTIGQMCRCFGVTPRALRFYEQKELLSPIREGQNRYYTPRDRARLKLILRGKRFGFSLAEIRELLELYRLGDGQVTQLSATLQSAERHRADLIAKRDELATAIGELEAQMDVIRQMLAERSQSRRAAE